MSNWSRVSLAVVLSVGLVGCSAHANEKASQATGVGRRASPQSTAADQRPDTGFMRQMLTAGMTEIAASRLAQERSTNAEVKELAEAIMKDHSEANQRLQEEADRLGVQVTPVMNEVHLATGKLMDLSGAAFDRAYIEMMVSDHQHAIDMVRGKAREAGNPQVEQWVSDTLPTLQKHLDLAQAIQHDLET